MRYRDRIWSPAVLLLTSVNLRISSIRSRLDIFSTYSTHINYAIVPPYTLVGPFLRTALKIVRTWGLIAERRSGDFTSGLSLDQPVRFFIKINYFNNVKILFVTAVEITGEGHFAFSVRPISLKRQ